MSFERVSIEDMRRREKAEEEASRILREMYGGILKAAVAEGLLPSVDSLEGWQREILMQELSREMALDFSSIRHSWHRTQKRIQEVQNAAQTPTGERHTFELSVQPEVLAACMRRMGREIEANGGVIEWDFVNNRTWHVKAIPEVTTEGETMLLTWRCGSVPGIDSDVHPVFDAPCIEWRVNPAFLGVRIDAICADVRFEKTFYQWIVNAETTAPQAQEAEDRRVEGLAEDWWAAVADEDDPSALPQRTKKELPIREGKTGQEKEPRISEAHQIAATAANYGIVQEKQMQKQTAELMGTSDRTYRKYRDEGWLLSEDEFRKKTGVSIAEYWEKKRSGK